MEETVYDIWISAGEKVASFHYVQSFEVRRYRDYNSFLDSIKRLISAGFSFE